MLIFAMSLNEISFILEVAYTISNSGIISLIPSERIRSLCLFHLFQFKVIDLRLQIFD